MNKFSFYAGSLLLASILCLTACSDDDNSAGQRSGPEISIEKALDTDEVVAGDTLVLKANTIGADGATVVWSLDGEEVVRGPQYEFTQTERGDYRIAAAVVTENGEASVEITIHVYGKYKYGTFVVNEGNMTSENGFLSFIDPKGVITDSVYYKVNGTAIGNVVQDMFIANENIYLVAQNGENMGGDGCLVIADAETLEKKAAYQSDKFQNNGRPAHVAVVGSKVFIQGNGGITLFDENEGTFTLLEGTKGAVRNNMVVIDGKVFASAGTSMLVLTPSDGNVSVEKVECPGRIGGIVKTADDNLWLACGGSPSTLAKVSAKDYSVIEQHDINEVALGLSRRTSPTICAKGDTIYMKAEGDRATQIYRHIFSSNQTEFLIDMEDELENGKQGYNAINVHPITGEVYINTIKGYGWDFLINDLSVWNFSGTTPVMVEDYQNHTHFPAGVYFTYSYLR